MSKNIWVLFESNESIPNRVSLELMCKASELAKEKGEEAIAVIIDPSPDNAVISAFAQGANAAMVLRQTSSFEADSYILEKLIEKYEPTALLIGATNKGRDISAALSASCHIGIASDCTDVMFTPDGISWIRPSYDGSLYANISIPSSPQIGTFRTGTFPLLPAKTGTSGRIIEEKIDVPAAVLLTRILGFIPDTALAKANLEEAEIIVAGGRGVGSAEGFEQIFKLAALLNGTVGASRAAVDKGWISHDHQIGATGKTVRPKLYMGFGISGAVAHVAGMKDSDVIVAVNTDPYAPIFEISHYGIVGDLHVVIPVLIKAFKELKA